MPELIAWPPDPPPGLADLPSRVAESLGASLNPVDSLGDLGPGNDARSLLVIVDSAEGLRQLEVYSDQPAYDIAVVISDVAGLVAGSAALALTAVLWAVLPVFLRGRPE